MTKEEKMKTDINKFCLDELAKHDIKNPTPEILLIVKVGFAAGLKYANSLLKI